MRPSLLKTTTPVPDRSKARAWIQLPFSPRARGFGGSLDTSNAARASPVDRTAVRPSGERAPACTFPVSGFGAGAGGARGRRGRRRGPRRAAASPPAASCRRRRGPAAPPIPRPAAPAAPPSNPPRRDPTAHGGAIGPDGEPRAVGREGGQRAPARGRSDLPRRALRDVPLLDRVLEDGQQPARGEERERRPDVPGSIRITPRDPSVEASHNRIWPSAAPVATSEPSGLTATWSMTAQCRARCVPSRATRSAESDGRRSPAGIAARSRTSAGEGSAVRRCRPPARWGPGVLARDGQQGPAEVRPLRLQGRGQGGGPGRDLRRARRRRDRGGPPRAACPVGG